MWITIKIQQYRELKNLKYILSQKYAELQELADEQWKASQKIERRVNCNGVQCLMPPKKDLHGTYDHPCVVTHYAYTTGYAFSRTWSAVPEEEKFRNYLNYVPSFYVGDKDSYEDVSYAAHKKFIAGKETPYISFKIDRYTKMDPNITAEAFGYPRNGKLM